MSGVIVLAAVAVGLALGLFWPGASEKDAMFRGDPERTGVYEGGGPKESFGVAWVFETDGVIFSSPAVSDGVVHFGSEDSHLYAVDAKSGKELWGFETDNGVRSSPAVSGGVVYFGSFDYHLYAVDAKSGRELWRFETDSGVFSSPAVSGGVVYVGSLDGNLYALKSR